MAGVGRSDLERLIGAGEIDTVIVALVDQQGRLLGKRFTARHFLAHVADHGMHACDYLLTVDLDLEPLPGYQLASWDQGYGDTLVEIDWSTLCLPPWQPGTALALGDPVTDDHQPISVSPRAILRRQVERAATLGFRPMLAAELEAYLFRETYAGAHARGYRDLQPFSHHLEDYGLLQGGREEPLLRQIRRDMEAAGIPIEGTKGEWGRGQIEFNLEYADALLMADRIAIFKHGAREIADAQSLALTFMAKPDADAAGSSCHIHASLWSADGAANRFWDADMGGPSMTFEHFLAGQLQLARDTALWYAPFVNSYKRYQSRSWAPTAIAWARDNRTAGLRVVGHGNGFRIENRLPGADCNPYLAFAAVLAAGLHGIEQRLALPPAATGNAYDNTTAPRVPTTIREAIGAWAGSAALPDLIGPGVHAHYQLTAEHEAAAFERAVTDWERARYFERV